MADAPRAFVCGHPIAHSRSPLIHGHWLRQHRLAGSYDKIDVSPADFPAFVAGLAPNGWAGGNVTLPHKETAFGLAARRDEAAEIVGAANTLWFEDGILCASNTDVEGFAANLDERVPAWDAGKVAVVLGAGGAARGIVQAMRARGFRDIRIVNRTVARATEIADRFGSGVTAHGAAVAELLGDADLLVNTTSLGMKGDAHMAADPALLPSHAIVTDIVYVPLMTPLLATASKRGLRVADGLGMLLHQAVPGFSKWFGVRPTVTAELRALVVADIEAGR
jgi:shikimate dehydrogenase